MNKKILIPALIITAALVGFGAMSVARKDSNQGSSTPATSMSDMNDKNMTKSDDTAPAAQAETANQVTYKGFAVSPKTLKVKKGTTVTWTNQDAAEHDVTPDVETADFKASELFGKGETHSVTFNTVGTYSYKCSPHPYMKGTIEVTE